MNKEKVEIYFRKVMTEGLKLDLSDPNLSETPNRVARMYCDELLRNVNKEFDALTCFPNNKKYDQIVMLDRIFFVSMCSHHLLPFSGYAWVLYVPNEKLVGASKMARLVTHYAKRPQLQEHLCHEVLEVFDTVVQPKGTMVVMRAIHGCMRCRGVNQYSGAGMMSSAVSGIFLEDTSMEQKGLEMIKISLADGRE